VSVIVGTRPEAIKMAPVVWELRKKFEAIDSSVCITGQHSTLLDEVLDFFEIEPDQSFKIMREHQSLAAVTGKVLDEVSGYLSEERPDIVLVHGDTATTYGASLAAFYQGIPIHHVEAGLRTHQIKDPFPEEFNRKSVALMASVHYAPTQSAKQNLLAEGVRDECVSVTGNTVVDAMQGVRLSWERDPHRLHRTQDEIENILPRRIVDGNFTLVTIHRRESIGLVIESVCNALGELAAQNPNEHFVFPVHPNPKVAGVVKAKLATIQNVSIIPALRYPLFLYLLSKCRLVISDSGGVQEEAPSFGKKVLVVRESTERQEALDTGFATLVDGSEAEIMRAWGEHRHSSLPHDAKNPTNPFGDGGAAKRIIERIMLELQIVHRNEC